MSLTSAAYAEQDGGTLSLMAENDLFHSDRYYTNGVAVSWVSAANDVPEWALKAACAFPLFPEGADVRMSYKAGQNMFTPSDIKLEDPPADDRPYAGWLYGAFGMMAERGDELDQIELTIGVVGSASLAERTQIEYHQIIDAEKPVGWSHQLKNEPGFVLTYQHSWRNALSRDFMQRPYDVTPHAGGALGNVYTYANAGITFRYGRYLPVDYGPPRIQPSLPGVGFFQKDERFNWYVFAGVEGRAVARNIFLDGNTFVESASVEKENLVGDLQYGVVFSKGNVRLSYTHVVRTREFKTQESTHQDFGAVSLSVQF